MLGDKYIKGLVSICIFTENTSDELFETLSYLKNQTYTNLEILILDSAPPSPDLEYHFDFICSIDSRIKYYFEEYSFDFIKKTDFIFSKASGEYFCFCNRNSWYAPEYFEFLVGLLNDNSSSNYAFCNYHRINVNYQLSKKKNISTIDEFRTFQKKNSLFRTISFFLINQHSIKNDLMYSIFRREKFDEIFFKQKFTNYTSTDFTRFIIFNFLQSSTLTLTEEPLIYIKNNCFKFSEGDFLKDKCNKTNLKIFNYLKVSFNILNYFVYTRNIFKKFIIFFLFVLNFITQIFQFLFDEMFSFCKKTLTKFGIKFLSNEIKYSLEESNKKIKLLNVTLIAVSTRDTEEALQALIYSNKNIDFGKIKLLSHYTPFCDNPKVRLFRIPKFNSVDDWCKFIVYELHKYIETEYALLVHADGFVVNASSWRNEFLNYDYIGAPWDIPNNDFTFRDINGKLIRVGNSVSIRSKKLLELPSQLNIPWIADHGSFNEDTFLCCSNRHLLINSGIKYATLDVAKYFAHESMIPEIKNITPFAFHKWGGTNSKYPNFFPKKKLDFFSIKLYIFIFKSILDAFKQNKSIR